MSNRYHLLILLFTAVFLAGDISLLSARQSEGVMEVLAINKEYDTRTVIEPSQIPNAGNGLFARVKIAKGEVIGELGGELVADNNYPENGFYIASIPECAWEQTHPYKYLDGQVHGGNVSRINFAPSEINGLDTGFQNATIQQLCEAPYFIYVARKDIEPGAEIWVSYGPSYDYDSFMQLPEIRDFFCSRLMIDCLEKYSYAP